MMIPMEEMPVMPKGSGQPNLGLPAGARPAGAQERMLVPGDQSFMPRNPMWILWVLFTILVVYTIFVVNSARTPENPGLRRLLVRYNRRHLRFTRIERFKQCMNTMAGSMASVPNRRECNGAYWPDTFGIMHHEGLLLEVNGEYDEKEYLELDYGRDGLAYRVWQVVPTLHAVIPEDRRRGQRFAKASIPFERGDPDRLIRLLDRLGSWRYNLFTFNCNTFADYVWNLYVS
jgi:hypothetical protein